MSDDDIMTEPEQGGGTGSIVESGSTRIVHGRNGGTLTPFTTETSRLASKRRAELRRKGAMAAIFEVTGTRNTFEAVKATTLPLVQQLMKGGKGIAPIHRELYRVADLIEDRRDGMSLPEGAGAVVVLSESATAGVAAALASYLKK